LSACFDDNCEMIASFSPAFCYLEPKVALKFLTFSNTNQFSSYFFVKLFD
jgi:hypothetical protein